MHVDAKITSKNQITLPRAVRERLGVKAGGRVRFEIGEDGVVRVTPRIGTFADLRGIIDVGRPVSTEEIREMVRTARDDRADHHLRVLAGEVDPRDGGDDD